MEKTEMTQVIKDELQTFKDGLGEFVSPEDMKVKYDELSEQVKELGVSELKDSLTEINEAIEKQGLALQEMKSTGEAGKEKSLKELLTEKADEIASVAKSGRGKISIELKTDVTRASVTDHTLAMRLTDVGQLARQNNVIEPLFASGQVSPNSNGVIRYVDQAAITNNMDWTAEGSQKPEDAITWVEKTLSIQKVASTIPVTMEAMDDVAFIESEIKNMLLMNLADKVDQDVYNGSGVAPIISGAYTLADTFTAAASSISDASIYDLIVKVREDIEGSTKYQTSYAVMNIADVNKMKLKKDGNDQYVLPPFSSQDGQSVDGIRVIASNSVTANTMLMGDFRYGTVYSLGGVTLDLGWIDKQFIENMMTLRAERRLALLIRDVHTDAFRKITDIDAALTTLAST